MLTERGRASSGKRWSNFEVAETFNVFLSNIVKEMNIPLGQELPTEADYIEYGEIQKSP